MLVRKKDTKRLYAMKVIRKDQVIKHNAVQHTMSEKNVLTRIKHPFIVSLKYSFQTESKLYMILDYIGGGIVFVFGNLFIYLKIIIFFFKRGTFLSSIRSRKISRKSSQVLRSRNRTSFGIFT